jgi:hypothetical protein
VNNAAHEDRFSTFRARPVSMHDTPLRGYSSCFRIPQMLYWKLLCSSCFYKKSLQAGLKLDQLVRLHELRCLLISSRNIYKGLKEKVFQADLTFGPAWETVYLIKPGS